MNVRGLHVPCISTNSLSFFLCLHLASAVFCSDVLALASAWHCSWAFHCCATLLTPRTVVTLHTPARVSDLHRFLMSLLQFLQTCHQALSASLTAEQVDSVTAEVSKPMWPSMNRTSHSGSGKTSSDDGSVSVSRSSAAAAPNMEHRRNRCNPAHAALWDLYLAVKPEAAIAEALNLARAAAAAIAMVATFKTNLPLTSKHPVLDVMGALAPLDIAAKQHFHKQLVDALGQKPGKNPAAATRAAAEAAREIAASFPAAAGHVILEHLRGTASGDMAKLAAAAWGAAAEAAMALHSPWLECPDPRKLVASLELDLVNVKEEHMALLGSWPGGLVGFLYCCMVLR